MKSIHALMVIVSLFLFHSCKKENKTTSNEVTINVASPLSGSTYHNGDSVRIAAAVSYDGILHGYEVLVTDSSTGKVIYNIANHVHTNSFNIKTSFFMSSATPMVLKMVINTQIDHSGKNVNKELYFNCTP